MRNQANQQHLDGSCASNNSWSNVRRMAIYYQCHNSVRMESLSWWRSHWKSGRRCAEKSEARVRCTVYFGRQQISDALFYLLSDPSERGIRVEKTRIVASHIRYWESKINPKWMLHPSIYKFQLFYYSWNIAEKSLRSFRIISASLKTRTCQSSATLREEQSLVCIWTMIHQLLRLFDRWLSAEKVFGRKNVRKSFPWLSH